MHVLEMSSVHNVLLRITLRCMSMALLALAVLTGGRGDALCPAPEAPVCWRLLSAAAPLSVPCQNKRHEL